MYPLYLYGEIGGAAIERVSIVLLYSSLHFLLDHETDERGIALGRISDLNCTAENYIHVHSEKKFIDKFSNQLTCRTTFANPK